MPVRGALAGLLAAAAVVSATPAYAIDPSDVPGDAAPPAPGAVVAAPVDVDTSEEAATVVVTARVTDSGSGVASVNVRLADGAPTALAPISGDLRDGDWSGRVTIPRATPHGPVAAFVEARDAAGNVATSSVHVARVADAPPAAPAAVVATAAERTVHVAWQAPAPNGGDAVEGYVVSAEATAPAEPVVAKVGEADREAVLTLPGDGTYVVRVAATNAAGRGADAVTDVVVGAAAASTPRMPRSVVVTRRDGAADLAWDEPAAEGGVPVTGYELRAVPASGVSAPPGATVLVGAAARGARVPGLTNGVPYALTVVALSEGGPGLPARAEVTPRAVPAPPVVAGTTAGDRIATVSWRPASDGGDPVNAYVVTAHPTGTTYVLPSTARSARIGNLVNGAALTFSVVAHNRAGASAPSAPSAVTTPRQPVRLTVLTKPRTTVTYGAGSHATARLTSLIGTPIAGRRVDLQAQVKPSTLWRTVYSGTTDATGFVRVSTALPATAGLRLRHPGDAYQTAHAWVSTVYVAPRVTASAPVVQAGHVLTVSGTVAPAHAAGSRVTLQRQTPLGWVNVADGAMTTTSAYRVHWRPRTGGWYPMRVVKHADGDHVSGVSPTWTQQVRPEGMAEIARHIKANARIALDAIHVSGRVDLATARVNVADLAAGRLARRSSYEGAPGGTTRVDTRLLKALRRMGERGRVTVSEIAGGSHSRNSTHYYGRGLDIRMVNGVPVSRGTAYGFVVEACRAFGAVRIFHPSYDPFGGHQGHVHCDWSS